MSDRPRWTRHLTEAVVIVGSILFAFGIDAWWDGRRDQALEHELLSAICEAVDSERASLRQYVDLNSERFPFRGLFFSASARELAALPEERARAVMSALRSIAIFEPGPSLARTTDLSNLGDPDVRTLLGRWRAAFADFEENARLHWPALLEVQRAGGVEFMARMVGDEMDLTIPEGADGLPSSLADLRANEGFVSAELRLQLLLAFTSEKAETAVELSDRLLSEYCSIG